MMAKKPVENKPLIKEIVWSKKYQCNLTKEHAIFDEVQDSWINMAIEKVIKTKEVKNG